MRFRFDKKNVGKQMQKGRGKKGFRFGWQKLNFEQEAQPIQCICPNCGLSVPHKHRVQCFRLRCPQCDSTMTRNFIVE